MRKLIKKNYIYAAAIIEVMFLTGIYYFFWRIGYTHGIEGYPEYLGAGKFILMGVYAILQGIILYFAGSFRYGKIRIGNIIIRQWIVLLAVNIITFLQLSLTAKHLVAKRPMFDATVVQVLFVVIFSLTIDYLIKHYNMAGKMLVLGDGKKVGDSFDGYKIAAIDTEEHTLVDMSSLFDKVDEYDAMLIQHTDETSEYLIKHCLEISKTVYLAKEDPTIYGVCRIKENNKNYILVLGTEDNEGKLFDKTRAYFA